jgi:hypothetical protein
LSVVDEPIIINMLSRNLKTVVLAFALMFAAVAFSVRALTRGVAHTSEADGEEHVVDPLDRVVQQRFHDVVGFGMARIASERKFVPESKEEKTAVKDLKRAGYEVGLYLVGRNILEDVPDKYHVGKTMFGGFGEHLMSGPVFVSRQGLKELPDARALWEQSREALRAFDGGGERYGFKADGWDVEARPVRASDEGCLRCHGFDTRLTFDEKGDLRMISPAKERNGLRVGDPLGAMLYVYRKSN